MYLVSGYHFVNRIGYLISTTPIGGDRIIQCRITGYAPDRIFD